MAKQLTFAAWLAQQLRLKGMNQTEFGKRIGVGSGTVSRWIHGQRPDTRYCDLIADALGADVDYVLELAGHRPRQFEPEDPDVRGMIGVMRDVRWTPERRRFIRSLLEDMRDLDREAAAK